VTDDRYRAGVLGNRFSVLLSATALVVAPLALVGTAAPSAGAPSAPRQISYHQWGTVPQFQAGVLKGVRAAHGNLRLATPYATHRYAGTTYDVGRWTSPWTPSAFALTELVPSWAATTPDGTWVQVSVRGTSEGGSTSSWDVIGRWASGDTGFRRTSQGAQRDDLARVATDTWEANYGGFTAWQLRATLFRKAGTTLSPRVNTIGAMVSALPDVDRVTVSRPGVARGIVLDVPRYSQMTHAGEYPRYGGGGEAWCSPTSTTMVLGYYGKLPAPAAYDWVSPAYGDRVVDHAARMTYDYGYGGTGNWPFNTAYAATQTGAGFVTRFQSLRGVEHFIRAGIPVVTSITFGRGQLSGAPIGATNGHLVVVVGFTSSGDVVVNDPAASTRSGVRRTYDRGQFENAWLQRYPVNGSMRGSGGLAYIIRDAAHPLPKRVGNTNW
jgi:hypothetical protein